MDLIAQDYAEIARAPLSSALPPATLPAPPNDAPAPVPRGHGRLGWFAWRLMLRIRRTEAAAAPPGAVPHVAGHTAGPPAPAGPTPGLRGAVRVRRAVLRPWLVRAISRRTRLPAVQRLRRMPGFAAEDYVRMHPQVAASGVDAAFHALLFGAWHGWPLFRPEALARALGQSAQRTARRAPPPPAAMPASQPERHRPVRIHVSSQGNAFMREIAEDLAATLAGTGVPVSLRDETPPPEPAARAVFVAPHEFFHLGSGPDWLREDVLTRAVLLNTEQVQTPWFARALPLLLSAGAVLDLNAQSADLLTQAGQRARLLTLAPPASADVLLPADRRHRLFAGLPRAARGPAPPARPFAERPLAVAFFGAASPARTSFFARNAAFFAAHPCVLHLRPAHLGPLRGDDAALTRIARHVSGHARITLNLHRDSYGYFEAHRLVRQAMAMGSVAVSESCLPHPLLRPGEHYFEAPARQLPEMLHWLLTTPDGQDAAARVQAQARAAVTTTLAPVNVARDVLAFLAETEAAA
jgi:hypothetical protein